MSAEIIQFVPRPRLSRPSLLEGAEATAEQFLNQNTQLSQSLRSTEKLSIWARLHAAKPAEMPAVQPNFADYAPSEYCAQEQDPA